MELLTIHAAEVQQIAKDFRARAAEAGDTLYRQLMLRTAMELEERAATLIEQGGSETLLVERASAAA
ncbi:MAG: hypothetical protein P4L57_03230 [Rhizomicrobium sp.]|nr:hypothetical protein [Rhizomicrobium sp.]